MCEFALKTLSFRAGSGLKGQPGRAGWAWLVVACGKCGVCVCVAGYIDYRIGLTTVSLLLLLLFSYCFYH